MPENLSVGLGDAATEILQLAELEARRAGSKEVGVRHLALALAQHESCRAAFGELAISPERLRAALLEGAPTAPSTLPRADEAAKVIEKAKTLLGANETAVGGPHLLRALIESQGAAAQAIARESGVPLNDLLNKRELLGLPVHTGRVQKAFERLGLRLKRLGAWTVRAFAWSALWAFVLFYLARWVLGGEWGYRWYPWLLLAAGAGCALGLAIRHALEALRSRSKTPSPAAPKQVPGAN